MHPIQNGILKKLTIKSCARFSDLKPDGIESNKFVYHLHQLTQEKLVKKSGVWYELTAHGRAFVDRISLSEFHVRIQPKIVTLIACQNAAGDYLLYRRAKEPFFGKVGFPYGKIHLGEKIADAALRELTEKTGLSARLSYRGDAYITVYDGDEVVSQMLCHVFSAQQPRGIVLEKSPIGECFWNVPKNIPATDRMFGFSEIVKLLETSPKPFFREFIFKSK